MRAAHLQGLPRFMKVWLYNLGCLLLRTAVWLWFSILDADELERLAIQSPQVRPLLRGGR